MLGAWGSRLCPRAAVVPQHLHSHYIQSQALLTRTSAFTQAGRYAPSLGTENLQRRTYLRVKVGGNLSQGDTRKVSPCSFKRYFLDKWYTSLLDDIAGYNTIQETSIR